MYSTVNYDYILSNILTLVIIALAATIIIYFVFMDKEESYTGIIKKIYDYLHFNTFLIDNILKFLYIFLSILLTILSLIYIRDTVLGGLSLLIFGNIILRIIFESIMVLYKIYINLRDINKKMK